MTTTSEQIRVIETKLRQRMEEGFNRAVQRNLISIEKQLNKLQNDFFTIMAMKIVDTPNPKLGSDNPFWKPLSPDYEDERDDRFGIDPGNFYEYSGAMRTTLEGLDAETIFGKPLVLFRIGDVGSTNQTFDSKGGSQIRYKSGRKAPANAKIDVLKAYITVDLYPRIKGAITNDAVLKRLWSVRTTRQSGKSRSIPLNYKLDNYQGQGDRPFLAQYLQWWMKGRARTIVRQSVGYAK